MYSITKNQKSQAKKQAVFKFEAHFDGFLKDEYILGFNAEIDGEIDQVYVQHGEKVVGPTQQKDASGKVTVVPGTRLAKMRNIKKQMLNTAYVP